MTNYQRFQILYSGEQHLFDPEGPVWVSRCQLTLDRESGRRLLQVRMVNRSQRTVRQVFLRLRCYDSRGQRLPELQMVPLAAVTARPGAVFGEDKPLEVTAADAVRVEVYPQRVRFLDGTAWDEAGQDAYLAYTPPVKMEPQDPGYDYLSRQALAGGVRDQFYFHSQRGVWTCTCGLPNGSRDLRCAACGADRVWLEKHMDPDLLKPPAPPVVPEAQAQPVQPVEQYLYYTIPNTVPVQQPEAAEPEPEKKKSGKKAAIVLLVLVLLAGAAFAGYLLGKPYLRYREGIQALRAGDYAKAQTIFTELGDYKDSPQRVKDSIVQSARASMSAGDYQKAMDLLQDMPDQQSLVADCVYSLGVLAYNGGDYDTAWSYVQQLEERFPDYDKLPQLRQFCCYSFGGRTVSEAAAVDSSEGRIECYNRAMQWYEAAGDYEDSAERVTECAYRIAGEELSRENWEQAVEAFTNLGDYKQSAELLQDSMYGYAMDHLDKNDANTLDYLERLAGAGYPGAQAMLDRLNGEGFEFSLSLGAEETAGRLEECGDLSQLYLHYRVEAADAEGAALVLAHYLLPDGRQGRGLLNSDRSASGARPWTDLFPADCRSAGTVTLEFYDSQMGETEPIETIQFNFTPPAAGGERP